MRTYVACEKLRPGIKFGFDYQVQCEVCGGMYNWSEGDDPFVKHQKLFPSCAFIIQLEQDMKKPVAVQYRTQYQRLATFSTAPVPIPPNLLAAAGFYYDGEQTQCFYCGVGLRDWGLGDDPFHVHLMFNPCCGYIRNTSNFQRLGISERADWSLADRRSLRQTAGASLIKDTDLQAKLDDVNTSLPLVKELLDAYDLETILKEMKLHIIETGRNYKTVDGFVTGVNKRNKAVRNRATGIEMTGPVHELSAENQRLRQLKLCNTCNKEDSVALLPCGHLVYCYTCAARIQECPVCSSRILGSVPVYYS
ncbi:baculoviral IAP repeat-containing protein 8-like isoform X1 [Haliotis asinina]|uniref:baculoviral IAP repeat-containing protein 8-like isoform X1 n=1 Tax=Haliotis asinina TaxID=109174 RepID=UPI0035319872